MKLTVQGADTSSTGLTALCFYLSRYPPCYRKLAAEIRSRFTSSSEIHSGPKLSSCHYLRACIDEALRMSPPITLIPYREVCNEGITVDGEYIPAGTDVGVSIYSLHHNEDLFRTRICLSRRDGSSLRKTHKSLSSGRDMPSVHSPSVVNHAREETWPIQRSVTCWPRHSGI